MAKQNEQVQLSFGQTLGGAERGDGEGRLLLLMMITFRCPHPNLLFSKVAAFLLLFRLFLLLFSSAHLLASRKQ